MVAWNAIADTRRDSCRKLGNKLSLFSNRRASIPRGKLTPKLMQVILKENNKASAANAPS